MDDIKVIDNPQALSTTTTKVTTQSNAPIIVLTVVVTLLVGFISFLLYTRFQNNGGSFNPPETTVISGLVQFTSLKPEPGDAGSLKLFYRESGTSNAYADAGISIPLKDQQIWEWSNAIAGKTYDMKVTLVIGGEDIKSSFTQTVSAPAKNIRLDLSIKWSDLPPGVVASSDIPISGQIYINGIIPEDGTVKVFQAAPNSGNQGVEVFSLAKPTSFTNWQWADAVPLTKYSITAVLLNGTNVEVGRSSEIVIAESADSRIDLTINSNATPPAPAKTTMSGTVHINGPINPSSVLVISAKRSTDPAFVNVAQYSNLTSDTNQWSWTEADSGQGYQLAAGIQINGQYISISAAKFITAPSTNIEFTINSNYSLPAPSGKVTLVECIPSKFLGGNPTANLTMPTINGAGKYWLQVGTQSGSSDTYDNKFTPDSATEDPTAFVMNLELNKTYYAKYSYSKSANSDDDSNFAPFSEVSEIQCLGIEPR